MPDHAAPARQELEPRVAVLRVVDPRRDVGAQAVRARRRVDDLGYPVLELPVVADVERQVARAIDDVQRALGVRPWIGVYYVPVTKQVAAEEGLDIDYGVWVSPPANGNAAVFPDSPAAAAGIEDGDIIVEVDGERIDADHDLAAAIVPHMPGDEVTLRILHGSSTREVVVTLGKLPTQ